MKANRIVACGLVAVALACAGVRPAVAAESYWYGEVNAAGNYVADPMGQSSFTNSAFWSLTKDVRPIVYDGSFQDPTVDYYLVFNGACRTSRRANGTASRCMSARSHWEKTPRSRSARSTRRRSR